MYWTENRIALLIQPPLWPRVWFRHAYGRSSKVVVFFHERPQDSSILAFQTISLISLSFCVIKENWIMFKGAMSWENLFMPYANNKGADQPAHPRSLISTFVVRCLDSIIPLVSIPEISILYLFSVAAQAGLSLPWSQTPKTGFLVTRLKYTIFSLEHSLVSFRAFLHNSTISAPV